MECTRPASQNLQGKVKEELVRGHELANQLRLVVGNGDGGLLAKRFVKKILCSYTTSLSLLIGNHESMGEHIQVINTSSTSLPIIIDSSSWNSLETIKSTKMFTDSSSSSKKRKISNSWIRDAPDFIDDGHAWRKYGEKQILNASHPRNYFRCSHKYDQGCEATKQVQKVADDPSLFRTTYFENHTCKHTSLESPELTCDNLSGGSPGEESSSMFMTTFQNNNLPNYEQEHPFFSSYKSTEREITKSNHVSNSQPSSLSCDLVKRDDTPMRFESSEPVSRSPATPEVQSEDYMALMECLANEILPIL